MTGARVPKILVAIAGGSLLGFLAGYGVVVRDPTGVGASILSFPMIVTVMILTSLLWAVSFAFWATSRRFAPYVFIVSPSLICAYAN